MTYKEITDLGWIDEYPEDNEPGMRTFEIKEEHGDWLLSINPKTNEDGFHDMVIIGWVEASVAFNRWENSETSFYGQFKTQEDLKNIMRYVGVIEY